ncbi:Skt5p [Rhizophagus irregularis DAOM 197198w]|uniref:Skt5p n=1 Tax=Rhizophagus irregularis (strain DAOM 197198w) TaxID=1432141 RepID=A0A015K4C6_RHIIW|nr:Skt5p [Rhizophagus irregularis DAOM 197198w]
MISSSLFCASLFPLLAAILYHSTAFSLSISVPIPFSQQYPKYGNAQCSLGYKYENGKGIDQDLKEAIYWYKKAAENGHVAAYYCLGKCYQDGIGIEKNEVKAFDHYKKSAEKGYLNGIYILGYCCENGIGTEIDKEKAVEWYKIAAKRGNKDAQKRLLELSNS